MKEAGQAPISIKGWTPFLSNISDTWGTSIWTSEADDDPSWDDFLQGTLLGHFQQSSAWARIKGKEGWRRTRFIVTINKKIVAGFQILWKAKFGLHFGYVSKGPILEPESGIGQNVLVALLQSAAKHLGLLALITQPPDLSRELEGTMASIGFLENRLMGVYSATVLVDLTRSLDQIEQGFSHDVRRQIRKQKRNNVCVRFGDAREAELFFDLMQQSCDKQKVRPNPHSPESVRAILQEFGSPLSANSKQSAGLLFAEQNGKVIAGFLLIRFGQCLSLLKKGAASDIGKAQPNRLLDWEAMQWGHRYGCKSYDVVAIERHAAECLLAGQPRGKVLMRSSDFYKLDFGGKPLLLPQACVWLPSLPARIVYKMFLKLYHSAKGT